VPIYQLPHEKLCKYTWRRPSALFSYVQQSLSSYWSIRMEQQLFSEYDHERLYPPLGKYEYFGEPISKDSQRAKSWDKYFHSERRFNASSSGSSKVFGILSDSRIHHESRNNTTVVIIKEYHTSSKLQSISRESRSNSWTVRYLWKVMAYWVFSDNLKWYKVRIFVSSNII